MQRALQDLKKTAFNLDARVGKLKKSSHLTARSKGSVFSFFFNGFVLQILLFPCYQSVKCFMIHQLMSLSYNSQCMMMVSLPVSAGFDDDDGGRAQRRFYDVLSFYKCNVIK